METSRGSAAHHAREHTINSPNWLEPTVPRAAPGRRIPLPVVLTLGTIALVASWLTVVGSDALWLPAMGDRILSERSIPSGIPFAAASSVGWVNTTALGQILMSAPHKVGKIGVVVIHVVTVVAGLTILAVDALRRGGRQGTTSLAILAVAVGAAAPLLIARAQLLSLLPFVLLLTILRRQHDRPSAAIWWVVPLLALWGNLHGAVLVGVAVTGCYLLLSRVRRSPITALAVGTASMLATCLNPGLLSAPQYYMGVLGGEATTDESGMWGPLNITNPFDVLLVVAALLLCATVLHGRHALWELVAGAGLLAATVFAARNGIWLMLFLAVPAASSFPRSKAPTPPASRVSQALPVVLALAFLVGASAVLGLRAPGFRAADGEASSVAAATSGQSVLAVEPLSEALAAAGATVWASNPLDAFAQHDQAAYLAFLRGDTVGAGAALEAADVVVALPESAQARLALGSGFSASGTVGPYTLFRRG